MLIPLIGVGGSGSYPGGSGSGGSGIASIKINNFLGTLHSSLSISQNGFHLHPPSPQNLVLCIDEHSQMTSHKEGEGGWSFCDIST